MYEIVKANKNHFKVVTFHYENGTCGKPFVAAIDNGDDTYNRDQIQELQMALDAGIDIEPLDNYNLTAKQIRAICVSLTNGFNIEIDEHMSPDNIMRNFYAYHAAEHDYLKLITNKNFSNDQLEQIRLGAESNLDVKRYAKCIYTPYQMCLIRNLLEHNMDPQYLENADYDNDQLYQIYMAIVHEVDPSNFANASNTASKMRYYRYIKELGFDIYDVTGAFFINIPVSDRKTVIKCITEFLETGASGKRLREMGGFYISTISDIYRMFDVNILTELGPETIGWFNRLQLFAIAEGISYGVPKSLIVNHKYTEHAIRCIYKTFVKGANLSNIIKAINIGFDKDKLLFIFNRNCEGKDVAIFDDPLVSIEYMFMMAAAHDHGVDITPFKDCDKKYFKDFAKDIEAGYNVSLYLNYPGDFNHRIIRYGFDNNIDILDYVKYFESLDKEDEKIKEDIWNDVEFIYKNTEFADRIRIAFTRKFSCKQLKLISKCFVEGRDIMDFINPDMDDEKLRQIEMCHFAEVSDDVFKLISDNSYDYDQAYQIIRGWLEEVDIYKYSDSNLTSDEMNEIRSKLIEEKLGTDCSEGYNPSTIMDILIKTLTFDKTTDQEEMEFKQFSGTKSYKENAKKALILATIINSK